MPLKYPSRLPVPFPGRLLLYHRVRGREKFHSSNPSVPQGLPSIPDAHTFLYWRDLVCFVFFLNGVGQLDKIQDAQWKFN